MLTIVLLIVFGYLLPTFMVWNWVRIAYSKGGIDESAEEVEFTMYVLMFIPGMNIIACLILWITQYPKPIKHNSFKFFNIKR